MDKIVDHLFVFRGNAVVEDFPGNYSDYRAYEDSSATEIRAGKEKAKEKSKELNAAKNTWKKEDKGNKLSYSEQQEYKKLEKEIKKLEFKKGEIEEQFVTGDLSVDEITELSKNLSEINVGIETKTERWFELSAIME
jgi:ATP-binding cassette subfamily F protein uup